MEFDLSVASVQCFYCYSVSIVDFEKVNVCWVAIIQYFFYCIHKQTRPEKIDDNHFMLKENSAVIDSILEWISSIQKR